MYKRHNNIRYLSCSH